MSRRLKLTVTGLLLIVTILYLWTGFEIGYTAIVESITFGIIGKALAFRLHDLLWAPFILLLIVHIVLGFSSYRQGNKR